MKNYRMLFLSLLLSLVCTCAARAAADAVTQWNLHAVQAVSAAGSARPGPSGSVDIAMMHAAVYDAVQAITGEYQPYRANIPGAHGSPAAAAAAAASHILLNRFPSQSSDLAAKYNAYLTANNISPLDPGIAVGQQAAAAIIEARRCEGMFPGPAGTFVGSTGIGKWRPTGPAFSAMSPGPWFGVLCPFTLESPDQFASDGPPALTSNQYAREYNEVKAYGVKIGSARSPEQTDMALFWSGNFTVMMNASLRQVSEARIADVSDSSRLFAMATMATADAMIATWNEKVQYNFWRPETAIQNGALDGNPKTEGDPTWAPLLPNPPYPDYGSGANAYTASTMYAIERFFGTDDVSLTITTTAGAAQQKTRSFDSLSQVMDEVVDARIFLGYHFRFADVRSRRLGHSVAKWGHQNYFRPSTGND